MLHKRIWVGLHRLLRSLTYRLNGVEKHNFQWRSSHPEVFCKKGVLRNIVKFTGKHLCQNLFLTQLQASGIEVFL